MLSVKKWSLNLETLENRIIIGCCMDLINVILFEIVRIFVKLFDFGDEKAVQIFLSKMARSLFLLIIIHDNFPNLKMFLIQRNLLVWQLNNF